MITVKKVLVLLSVTLLTCISLVGCAGPQGNRGADGVSVVSPPVVTAPSAIDELIAEENDYRLSLGQTALTNGLSCTLYTVTGGDRIQSSIAGHNTLTGITTVGTFLLKSDIYQVDSPISDGMSVLPLALRNVYKNMYLLRCTGYLVVLNNGYYEFNLTSDDGSLLYINGSKIIDNDNNHGTTTVSASKSLRKGVHTIRLDYAQTGGGNQSLMLTSSGVAIPHELFYH